VKGVALPLTSTPLLTFNLPTFQPTPPVSKPDSFCIGNELLRMLNAP
jgi:hypothetical protein